jgi:TRAP-type mannitol/chloroaromatic compound transport system permease small subunit
VAGLQTHSFIRTVDTINDWVGRAVSLFVLLIFFLLMMEVFARYLFNAPSVWANELSQMIFGAYVVLSGGHILWRAGHVNVDIVHSRFSPRGRALLDVITSFLFFAFCIMMIYYGGSLAWDSIARWEHSQSAWNAPVYPVKLTIPIGAVLLFLQGLAKLIRDILVLSGKEARTMALKPAKEETR